MSVHVFACTYVCVCHCIGTSVSATDKSPLRAARQHRDMGKRVGVDVRLVRGAGEKKDVVKEIKESNMDGHADNRTSCIDGKMFF